METICFILLCYGLSNMVVYSKGPFDIFEKWRNIVTSINENFGELFSCMMCFPFYAGVFVSLINTLLFKFVSFTPMNYIFREQGLDIKSLLLIVIFDGIISSGTTWIIHNIEEFFEKQQE